MRRAWALGLALAGLLVLGAGGPTAPAAAQTAQRSLGEGAWSWFADPRAVRHDGSRRKTYVSWVSDDGDVTVSAYDHDSFTRTTAVIAERLQVDDHANPALRIRPDGRVVAYYSAHNGLELHYRVSTQPEDVNSWGAGQKMTSNTTGSRGYTYPNPIRLSGESRTYLFWRGGNYNPTFSTQQDGQESWAAARNLIVEPGQRPYVKYATNGTDTIGFAFTNAHPSASGSTSIYYARYRGGGIQRANGTQIGTLAQPITPGQADKIYDTTTDGFAGQSDAWVHDTAIDSSGRPVIVFAVFASAGDHRYFYARWNGTAWERREITPAGGSISGDGREPYYSGGITLDHEDPSTVYLSRQVNGIFEIETRTTSDGGATWSTQPVTSSSTQGNYRPVSPRGTIPFGGDMGLVWMRGAYDSYLTYRTSLAAQLANGGAAPVADTELSPSRGQAPLDVRFDGSGSRDSDGTITGWSWDFGDGTGGTGAVVNHAYTVPGRYFAKLTVTDNSGAQDVYVTEVEVGVPSAPDAHTGSTSAIGTSAATVHGTVSPNEQATTYRFDYGTTDGYGSSTAESSLSAAGEANRQVSAALNGLTVGRTYHYRLVARNASGQTVGSDRTFTAGSSGTPSAYRDAVQATGGLRSYWRLGEPSGNGGGAYRGRFRLGELGALTGDRDTAAHFDGASGEMAAAGPTLSAAGTLEGWFHWGSGVTVMRDTTSGAGWLLAFDSGGSLAYRVGGSGFNTGRTTASVRNGWHHLVATKNGGATAFYIDGQLVHSGTGAASNASVGPWHVMRNGVASQFAEGKADEVALYDRALSATEVQRHFELGRSDRNAPDTWIAGGPAGRNASFELLSNEPGSFTCRLDGPGTRVGTTGPCSSPRNYAGLASGSYRFLATARDAGGNADPSAAARSFSISAAAAAAPAPRASSPLAPTGPSSAALSATLRADLLTSARSLRRLGRRRPLRRRRASARARAIAGGTVAFTAKRGRTTILTWKKTFARAGQSSIRLKLTRKGRRLLLRNRRLRLVLRASFVASSGAKASASRSLTFRR